MKKIIFFLIISLIFNNKSFSNTNISSEYNSPLCKNKINQKYIEEIDKLKIKKIEIDNNNLIEDIVIIYENFHQKNKKLMPQRKDMPVLGFHQNAEYIHSNLN